MLIAEGYPLATQPAPLRFILAIALISLVFLLDAAAGEMIDEGSLFLLLATAVMTTAWFAGTGSALAATVTGAVVGATVAPESPVEARAAQTHLALFVVHGLLLTALVSELRRTLRVAERQAGEALAARRESEDAGRMKDEFLATVSHELRTPLNAVLGWVHLLRTGKLDAATAGRGLETIERNVRLQAQLTGDLLDVSRALTGKLRLESRSVSLGDAVRQAVVAALPAAKARGVRVASDVPDQTVPVLGDPSRLRQIVWHLVTNSIKFTPKGGTIEVRVDRAGAAAVLTVADSGPGIAPEFLPRVFDRFTQADPSPTRTAGGLGMGLSLTRDLVELHGGEIRADNRTDTSGALFTVQFPICDLPSSELEMLAWTGQVIPYVSHLEGVRVLVVDQDADGRDVLRALLQRHGAMVQTAGSVGDALEALEAWRPDVLVSDSGTPDRASYLLVGKVQTLEAHRGGRIPAAALTAFARTDGEVRRMLGAAQRDLPKPVEPSVLTAEVARLSGREQPGAARAN